MQLVTALAGIATLLVMTEIVFAVVYAYAILNETLAAIEAAGFMDNEEAMEILYDFTESDDEEMADGEPAEVATDFGVTDDTIRLGISGDLSGPFAALVTAITEGGEIQQLMQVGGIIPFLALYDGNGRQIYKHIG